MVTKFKDDKVLTIESDIEKVQVRTNMYIGYRGEKGVLHLSKEIINNMIDEMINKESPADVTVVNLYEEDNCVTVSDNGRGIPFENLEDVCTKLQSGSKMVRATGGGSAGENGVGLTAVNALSSEFIITSRRYGKERSLTFVNGKKVSDVTEDISKDDHGTSFSFIPNEFYMDNGNKEGVQIQHSGLYEWLEMVSYLLPEDLVIEYIYHPKKGKVKSFTFENDGGQLSYLKKLHKGPFVAPPFGFTGYREVKDTDRGVTYDRHIFLDVAFAIRTKHNEIVRNSFCNFVNTVDRGTHADAVEQTIANELVRETRKSLSERDKGNLEITRPDVYNSLVVTLNVNTDINPDFSSQVKDKVDSTALSAPIRDMVREAMEEYQRNNRDDYNKILRLIRSNARMRMNMDELREARPATKGISNLDISKERKYIPPRGNLSKRDYSEILVVEGDSGGEILRSQGFSFQAAIKLKGVPINALTRKEARVMSNEEIRAFIKAGRAGVGKTFNVDDFFFNKVIIMTDSDVDGNKIFSSFLVFIACYMPELLERGMVYRVYSPLYEIKDKKQPFVLNRVEFGEVFIDRISENIILDKEDGTRLTKEQFKQFLILNEYYLDELRRMGNLFKTHPDLVEFIAINHSLNESQMSKLVSETFEEMTWKNGMFTGVYEGEFQFVNVNKRFLSKIIPLLDMVLENEELYYTMHVKGANGYNKFGHISIGQILAECEAYRPTIIRRFKGLGELNGEDLREHVLSPKRRLLVRVTVDDIDEAMETISLLHGGKPADRVGRRKLVDNHKIRRDELDN